MKISFLVCVCLILPLFAEADVCGPFEEYKECGPACTKTCDNKDIQINCIDECVEGCFCQEGYVRNADRVCVKPNDCPKGTCPRNEVYSICVNPCNDCEIRGKCNFLVCNKGCDCREGYYRSSIGVCIPASRCPVKPTQPPTTCGRDEKYYDCVPYCQQTCGIDGRTCKFACRPGCYCKEGLFKRDDGKCVHKCQCSKPNTPPDNCGVNEAVTDCAKPKFCNTCEIRGDCKLKDCKRGCDCIPDYYRNEKGICRPQEECPGNG